jgi:hypothetical protein
MKMTTVGELLDYLLKLPRDQKVLLADDPEGNGFSFLAEAGEATVHEEYRPDGIYPTQEEHDAMTESEQEDYGPVGPIRVVTLWPV